MTGRDFKSATGQGMITLLRKLFGTPYTPPAPPVPAPEDLDDALTRLDAERDAVQAAIGQLQAQRRRSLLADDDNAVTLIDRELDQLYRDLERGEEIQSALLARAAPLSNPSSKSKSND